MAHDAKEFKSGVFLYRLLLLCSIVLCEVQAMKAAGVLLGQHHAIMLAQGDGWQRDAPCLRPWWCTNGLKPMTKKQRYATATNAAAAEKYSIPWRLTSPDPRQDVTRASAAVVMPDSDIPTLYACRGKIVSRISARLTFNLGIAAIGNLIVDGGEIAGN